MPVEERRRVALHRVVAEVWGEEAADTLLELVTPAGHEPATRGDVADLRRAIEAMDAGAAAVPGLPGDAGLVVRFVDSALVVTRVEHGAPAQALGIRPGWIIDEIDTLKVRDALRALKPGGTCTAVGYYLSPHTGVPLMHMYATDATLRVGVSSVRPVLPELLDFVALVLQIQLVLAPILAWTSGGAVEAQRTLFLSVGFGATVAMWLAAVSFLSKAGINQGLRRAIFILIPSFVHSSFPSLYPSSIHPSINYLLWYVVLVVLCCVVCVLVVFWLCCVRWSYVLDRYVYMTVGSDGLSEALLINWAQWLFPV